MKKTIVTKYINRILFVRLRVLSFVSFNAVCIVECTYIVLAVRKGLKNNNMNSNRDTYIMNVPIETLRVDVSYY